jgi:hypothetical protein
LSRKVDVVKFILSIGVSIVLAFALCDVGLAQPAVSNSGTLTCTISETAKGPDSSTAELSCDFKASSGLSSDYSGTASTNTGDFPPGKHVFIWSVVAIESGKVPLLEGTFRSEAGRLGPAVLLGGADGNIRLEPVTGNEKIAGPAEITTLSLKLAVTKTRVRRSSLADARRGLLGAD